MTISGITTVGELISALQLFPEEAIVADGKGRSNFTACLCEGEYPDDVDFVRIEA